MDLDEGERLRASPLEWLAWERWRDASINDLIAAARQRDELLLRIKLHEDPVFSRRQIISERDALKEDNRTLRERLADAKWDLTP